MKTFISAGVICMSTVAWAQPGLPLAKPRAQNAELQRDKVALDERMGQRQLDLLIDSVLQRDASADASNASRQVQSAQR